MKKLNCIQIVFVCILTQTTAFSQIADIGKLLSGGASDGEKLIGAYISPYANALGSNLAAGWYNTAKPHKLGGFDLTLTVNTCFIPTADKTFNPNELGLDGTSSSSTSPTAAGSKNNTATMSYDLKPSLTGDEINYNLPQGTGLSFVPAPMIKAGVGFIKKTEIMGRYLPNVKIGKNGSLGMWGVGLKHDLMQYFGPADKIPVFNMSFMYAYTQLKNSTEMNITPDLLGAKDLSSVGTFDNQRMGLTIGSHTLNILISADLPVVTFYGGAGLLITNTNLFLYGNYPQPTISGTEMVVYDANVLKDPINIKIKNSSGSVLAPRLNAGIRFKMGIITLHFDYTKADYSIASAGLGISFR